MRQHVRWLVPGVVALATAALIACGPAASPPAASQPAAAPAPAPQAAPAKPAPAAQPAAPAKPAPAAQPAAPAKPAAAAQAPKPAASGEPRKMLFGSTNTASSHYTYVVALTKVINAKVPGVNATVVETGAAVENTNRMGRGEFDAGIVTADVSLRAFQGIGLWKDKPIKDLRWLWLYNLNQHTFIVREDTGIKKIEELTGKDFNPCMRGSACEQMTKDAFDALGIKPKFYIGSTDDAIQAIKDRRVVGYGKPMGGKDVPDASHLDLMTATKIRVLSFTEEQAKKVVEAHPYYAFTFISPNVFKDQEWNKEPIRTMAIAVGIGGTSRMPEDLAYAIVKATIEDNAPGGGGVQAASFPGVKGWDFAKLTTEEGLLTSPPLHAGAYKFYKEIGKKIPDALMPPEAKR